MFELQTFFLVWLLRVHGNISEIISRKFPKMPENLYGLELENAGDFWEISRHFPVFLDPIDFHSSKRVFTLFSKGFVHSCDVSLMVIERSAL